MDPSQVTSVLTAVLATAQLSLPTALATLSGTISIICMPLTGREYGEDAQLVSLEILTLVVPEFAKKHDENMLNIRTVQSALTEVSSRVTSMKVKTKASGILALLPGAASTQQQQHQQQQQQTYITKKKQLQGIQISMKGGGGGLLGNKEEEDQYIAALLHVEGVTSVTIDRKREMAICYTYEDDEIKSVLYQAVQQVSDKIRDAAGRPRITILALQQQQQQQARGYLDDDEDENDAENQNGAGNGGGGGSKKQQKKATDVDNDDDFFGGAIVTTGGGGFGTDKSAADRLREKDGNNNGGGGGWFSSVISSWW